jgi:hypothetical protein
VMDRSRDGQPESGASLAGGELGRAYMDANFVPALP